MGLTSTKTRLTVDTSVNSDVHALNTLLMDKVSSIRMDVALL